MIILSLVWSADLRADLRGGACCPLQQPRPARILAGDQPASHRRDDEGPK